MTNNNLIPRKILFGNPDKVSVKISPDGQRISYISERAGVPNVYVANRETPDKAVVITNDKKRGIREYHWAYDNKHILYLQDKEGDEDFHLYKVSIDTREIKDLTPFKKTRAVLIKSSECIPDKIIMGLNNRDPEYFDLYEANLVTGKIQLIYLNKDKLTDLKVGDDGNKYSLQFATEINDDGSKIIYKMKNNSTSELFLKIPIEDVDTTGVVGFGKTSDIVYVLNSINRNTPALILYDQRNKTSETIFHDDEVDIRYILFKPCKRNPQIIYNTLLRRTEHILDNEIKNDIDYLNAFDKDCDLYITSRDLDDRYWLISYLSDKKPITYYLYEKESKKLTFLFISRKELNKYELSPMWPVTVKSRDELDLISYITLPLGVLNKEDKTFIPTKSIPLVLLVHGGPKGARDTWRLDNIHQWLANRGYAVLSVNYRSSGGFGKKFMNAGDGEWARKMHYDLIDAVNWAIDNKITTKDKVSIFGISYGGYAALVGLTFTPDVFACAIDMVGPSNLVTLIKSVPKYWASFYKELLKMIGGDPDTGKGVKFLKSRSPLTFTKNIKKPLLIGQGANDPRVKQAEADQIVAAMKEHNIPVTYLLYPDEGHTLVGPENRDSFYAVTEQFLAKNLGGRVEPIGNALRDSSVMILEGKEYIVK